MMNFKRIAFKISVLISTAYAVIMLLHWPIGFTFFTQLSNIYAAAVVLLQLISRKKYPLLKYSATVSIFITFAVYLLVLAPMMPGGIFAAYRQDHYASFCLHILTPVFMIADFFLNDTEFRWEKKHLLYAVLPPVCYLIHDTRHRRFLLHHCVTAPCPPDRMAVSCSCEENSAAYVIRHQFFSFSLKTSRKSI